MEWVRTQCQAHTMMTVASHTFTFCATGYDCFDDAPASPSPARILLTLSLLRSFSPNPFAHACSSGLSVRVPMRRFVEMRGAPLAWTCVRVRGRSSGHDRAQRLSRGLGIVLTASWHRSMASHTRGKGPSRLVP